MPLEIICQDISFNETKNFTFKNKISQHMLGISYLYAGSEFNTINIQIFSLSLQSNYSEETLTVTANATLHDKDGHSYWVDHSWIRVVAIAWTDTNASNLLLTNSQLSDIENNSESKAIYIPTQLLNGNIGAPNPLVAALAGFNFNCTSSGDLSVRAMAASVGAESNIFSPTATVTGSAFLEDGNGYSANSATADGALLANCDPDLTTFSIIPVNNISGSQSFSTTYTNSMALLSGFVLECDKSNPIQFIEFGISSSIASGKCVVSGGILSTHVDPALSSVTGFVVLY